MAVGRPALVLISVLVLASCGDPTAGFVKEGHLRVSTEYKDAPESSQTTGVEIDCTPKDEDAKCRAAYRLLERIETATPDTTCTEQYGGPQQATIKLENTERTVTTTVARTNGCDIALWDDLVPLVPEPVTSGGSPVQ